MVLTRSQRPASGGGSDPEPTIQKTDTITSKKRRRAKSKSKGTPNPAESDTVASPIPDSTKPPLALDSTSSQSASDKDEAVVDTATEDLPINRSSSHKGKRRRRRNRKRKLAVEDESETGNSSEKAEDAPSSISSSTSAPDLPSQQEATKEGDKQDQHRENLEPPAKTFAPNDNQSQKENVNKNSTTEEGPEAEDVDGKASSDLGMQQIQPADAKKIIQLYKKESYVEGQAAKPKGQPKSGRPWKTEQTARFSGMKQDRPLKSSWQKKMQQKAEMKNLKTFEAELKEAWNSEQERKKQHRAKKIKRKLENQRKSEVVQMISNPAKIKRMKRKQLRQIEKRSMPDDSVKQVFPS